MLDEIDGLYPTPISGLDAGWETQVLVSVEAVRLPRLLGRPSLLPEPSEPLCGQSLRLPNALVRGLARGSCGNATVSSYEGAVMFGARGLVPYLVGSGYVTFEIPNRPEA